MKKTPALLLSLLFATLIYAQEDGTVPKVTIKWAPTGLTLGSASLQGEYNFGKSSLTAKIGVPASFEHTFQYDGRNADFNMKATSFLAGYRTYLSKKHMRGLYFEPYFKYVHHISEGSGTSTLSGEQATMNFTNDYNGVGIGAELGAQFFIGKRFVIDLFFLGPEINSSNNNFKAMDVSSSLPWTDIKGDDAKRRVEDFINKFPFVRNRTNVMVDENNKTVTASFSGLLPGYRIGFSIGMAL